MQKYTFIICNLSFGGNEEEKQERSGERRLEGCDGGNQTLCEIETGVSHRRHKRTSNHMWHLCYWPMVDCKMHEKSQRDVLPLQIQHMVLFFSFFQRLQIKRGKYIYSLRENRFFLNSSVSFRLYFQRFFLQSRFQCEVYLLKGQYSCLDLILGHDSPLYRALKRHRPLNMEAYSVHVAVIQLYNISSVI